MNPNDADVIQMAERGRRAISQCQICESKNLESIAFLGYLQAVNEMPEIGETPEYTESYPAEVFHCRQCHLVQLGYVVEPEVIFPPSYPYLSGSTKILRENFADLEKKVSACIELNAEDLVVDIGSNDGTLLKNFKCRTLGVEPTDAAKVANAAGVKTLQTFFSSTAVSFALSNYGQAKVVTAANVFAHIDDVHAVMRNIRNLLLPEGLFVSESHYVESVLHGQWDTVYHEHLRYYSLHALETLFAMHEMEIVNVERIPTHGGSIRVYAAHKGVFTRNRVVDHRLKAEKDMFSKPRMADFEIGVADSAWRLKKALCDAKLGGCEIYGVGAPSRASTLISYTGINHTILRCVVETPGAKKIGKFMPGTRIPVVDEKALYEEQPEYALMLAWHIADELMPKLRTKGFRGKFIIPLPEVRIIE